MSQRPAPGTLLRLEICSNCPSHSFSHQYWSQEAPAALKASPPLPSCYLVSFSLSSTVPSLPLPSSSTNVPPNTVQPAKTISTVPSNSQLGRPVSAAKQWISTTNCIEDLSANGGQDSSILVDAVNIFAQRIVTIYRTRVRSSAMLVSNSLTDWLTAV